MNILQLNASEVIDILTPKIRKELCQTDIQNRKDLEQELILMIIETIQTKQFKTPPTFLELLDKENFCHLR